RLARFRLLRLRFRADEKEGLAVAAVKCLPRMIEANGVAAALGGEVEVVRHAVDAAGNQVGDGAQGASADSCLARTPLTPANWTLHESLSCDADRYAPRSACALTVMSCLPAGGLMRASYHRQRHVATSSAKARTGGPCPVRRVVRRPLHTATGVACRASS